MIRNEIYLGIAGGASPRTSQKRVGVGGAGGAVVAVRSGASAVDDGCGRAVGRSTVRVARSDVENDDDGPSTASDVVHAQALKAT
jgi:hypothetical protein